MEGSLTPYHKDTKGSVRGKRLQAVCDDAFPWQLMAEGKSSCVGTEGEGSGTAPQPIPMPPPISLQAQIPTAAPRYPLRIV